jgi:hypothetical protein
MTQAHPTMKTTANISKKLVRKVHDVGGAKCITLASEIVQLFGIDEYTYVEEHATTDGILLKLRRLTPLQSKEKGVTVVTATATERDIDNEHNHTPS